MNSVDQTRFNDQATSPRGCWQETTISSGFARSDDSENAQKEGRIATHPARSGDARTGGGAQRPLNLIREHLTDEIGENPATVEFRACSRLKNWSFPSDWEGPDSEGFAQVLKIQSFDAGGFEATVRPLNLKRIGSMLDRAGVKRGKREKPEEADPLMAEKSGARAKRKVRHLVKNMGATNLATFTRRESDPETFWTAEDWANAWDRLRRGVERVQGKFPYVAILERHQKGNFHLHVAWVGKVNLNVVRPIWWSACGGRGEGNVQSQFIKVRHGLLRSDRVARYISKYVTKMFEDEGRFNKKRYWASRQSLPDLRRYVLRVAAYDLNASFREVERVLGLDWATVPGGFAHQTYVFPDGSGFWLNLCPDGAGGGFDPPPF